MVLRVRVATLVWLSIFDSSRCSVFLGVPPLSPCRFSLLKTLLNVKKSRAGHTHTLMGRFVAVLLE